MNRADYPLIGADGIPTPALLYYRHHIAANIRQLVRIAGDVSRLRPHIKTFKSTGVIRMLMEAGVTRYKCATIAEAELLARTGVTDVWLAYQPVGPTVGRVVALLAAYPSLELTTLVDTPVALAPLATATATRPDVRRRLRVAVDIQTGLRRTGIPLEEAASLTRATTKAGLSPGGLHFYDGDNHEHEPTARCARAARAHHAVIALAAELRASGVPVPRIVMGGTPTLPCYAKLGGAELSPGTAVIHDWGYARLVPDLPFVPAGLVLGRVISIPDDGRFTVDVGSKAIAADPPGARGTIVGHADARPVLQNEEHWVFECAPELTPRIAEAVLIVPTHICPTTALYDEALVVEADGTVTECWPIEARSRRITV